MSRPLDRLREMLAGPGMIRSLGIHDVFSGLLAEQAGVELVFTSGFGTSASLLGLPDLDFLTQTELADTVRRTVARLTIPVIADGDTGHGDLPQVRRTVELVRQAGAAGVILEDQVQPKRCGHFDRKQVIPAEQMVRKLRAARQAAADDSFVIVARTDARAVEGFDAAVDRANRYGDCGADVVFLEAPESREEVEAMPSRIRFPQVVNLLTGGKTPLLGCDELAALGYQIAVWPIETLLVCGAAIQRLLAELAATGRADGLIGEMMMSFDEVKRRLGLEEFLRQADEPGGV